MDSDIILLFPPAPLALCNEHPARNDRPWLGKFSCAAEWLFGFAVLRPADDGELVSPACRHSGCERRATGLSVGDTNAPGEASAIAPRGLAGSDDSVPVGDRSRLHLS